MYNEDIQWNLRPHMLVIMTSSSMIGDIIIYFIINADRSKYTNISVDQTHDQCKPRSISPHRLRSALVMSALVKVYTSQVCTNQDLHRSRSALVKVSIGQGLHWPRSAMVKLCTSHGLLKSLKSWCARMKVCTGQGLPRVRSTLVKVCTGQGLNWSWSAPIKVCTGHGLH